MTGKGKGGSQPSQALKNTNPHWIALLKYLKYVGMGENYLLKREFDGNDNTEQVRSNNYNNKRRQVNDFIYTLGFNCYFIWLLGAKYHFACLKTCLMNDIFHYSHDGTIIKSP